MSALSSRCQQVVVGAVIPRDDAVLLLQRGMDEAVLPGLWELPSGKKEPGETTPQALLREVKEETGLQVELIRPCAVFDYEVAKADRVRETTQITFLCRLVGGELTVGAEHADAAWVPISALGAMSASDETKQAIRAAFA